MPRYQHKRKQFLILSIAWAAALLILALQPGRLITRLLPREFLQCGAHAIAYAIFAYLLCFNFKFQRSFVGLRMTDVKVYAAAFSVTCLWGGATELIQAFTKDRRPDWYDFFYNVLGSIAGILFFILWHAFLHHRREKIKTFNK